MEAFPRLIAAVDSDPRRHDGGHAMLFHPAGAALEPAAIGGDVLMAMRWQHARQRLAQRRQRDDAGHRRQRPKASMLAPSGCPMAFTSSVAGTATSRTPSQPGAWVTIVAFCAPARRSARQSSRSKIEGYVVVTAASR